MSNKVVHAELIRLGFHQPMSHSQTMPPSCILHSESRTDSGAGPKNYQKSCGSAHVAKKRNAGARRLRNFRLLTNNRVPPAIAVEPLS